MRIDKIEIDWKRKKIKIIDTNVWNTSYTFDMPSDFQLIIIDDE